VTQAGDRWLDRLANNFRDQPPLPADAPLGMRMRTMVLRAILIDAINFSGRINRTELMAGLGLWVVWTGMIGLIQAAAGAGSNLGGWELANIYLTAILILVPLSALFVRRLHDVDRHGWALVVVLIPWVGWGILLGLLLWKGNPDYNLFGPPPGQQS
jgi:uncharacterized membrane protein YhaH (DUF805 family)